MPGWRSAWVAAAGGLALFLALVFLPNRTARYVAWLELMGEQEDAILNEWNAVHGQYVEDELTGEELATFLSSDTEPAWVELNERIQSKDDVPQNLWPVHWTFEECTEYRLKVWSALERALLNPSEKNTALLYQREEKLQAMIEQFKGEG